jgi:hypothetical protein
VSLGETIENSDDEKARLARRFFASNPTTKVGMVAWYNPGAVPRK